MRAPVVLSLLLLLPATAMGGECEDDFAECQDDCLIQYGGSIKVEMKKRYEKCAKKCSKKARQCTERRMETRNNSLEEGSLDRSPTSDQVDSDGLPTREKSSGKSKRAAEPVDHDDDLKSDEPSRAKEELPADEVPKSSRTTLKVEEKKAPPPETKQAEAPKASKESRDSKEDARGAPEEAPVIRMTPKKDDGKSAGDDLRDDGPREESPAVDEALRPKRREKPKEPPPKKEEDHDDLRNY